MNYNKTLKSTIILCGLLSPTTALLAQDAPIVKAETGNCNTVMVQNSDGTITKTSQCNNDPSNVRNTSDIQKKVSSIKSKARSHTESHRERETH